MTRLPEAIRPYLRRAGFEYVAYMVEFEHDWPLASALLERWRPESHTFHLAFGEMTITLQDVAYQLRLKIDGDPVSGADDRQSQMKWTVKLTWFLNTVCEELELDATEERLLRTSMLVVGCRGDRLYWLGCTTRCAAPRSMMHNLGCCVSHSLGPTTVFPYYVRMDLIPVGFRLWVQYRADNARSEGRLRHYRRVLNGIGILALEGLVPHAIAEADHTEAVVCPQLYFAIVEWHQLDRVVQQFGGLQHIPTRPLDILIFIIGSAFTIVKICCAITVKSSRR
ncbi:uncharacterized protein DS421_13g392730 [Arachis hypogaea]|nr:uncharacterized protein DS421_13g392730 [Arachis hypogaea]